MMITIDFIQVKRVGQPANFADEDQLDASQCHAKETDQQGKFADEVTCQFPRK